MLLCQAQSVHHVHRNTAQEASPCRKSTGRQLAQENELITAAAGRWKLPSAASQLVIPTWLHISEGRMSRKPATASGKQQRTLREQPLHVCSVQINTNKCSLASDISRCKIIHLQVQVPFTETREALGFFLVSCSFFGRDKICLYHNTELLIREEGKQVNPWEFEFSRKYIKTEMPPIMQYYYYYYY